MTAFLISHSGNTQKLFPKQEPRNRDKVRLNDALFSTPNFGGVILILPPESQATREALEKAKEKIEAAIQNLK